MNTPDGISTPDGSPPLGGDPIAAGQAPAPANTSTMPTPGATPSPGVALAGARVPTAPTISWDPTQLATVMAQLANDLFSPTVAPSSPGAPSIPAGALIAEPPAVEPSKIGPSNVESPFHIAPRFDALGTFAEPSFDVGEAFRLPLVAAPPAPTEATVTSPPIPALTTAHELDPTPDLGLARTTPSGFDAYAIRRDFPILEERPHGKRLVWLDNAATTQKPLAVIERLSTFYRRENSNVHRAAHTLAARATDAYEKARGTVRRFLNAPSTRDIVFVRGATEGINLVAQSWGRRNVEAGDEIVLTHLEHHANIVPWQLLAQEKGARLRVAPVDDRGQIVLDEYEKLLGKKTRLVALPQVSNALGTITPTKQMVQMAQRHGATVLVDGAQAVSHMRVDVQELGADFYVFSGHKVFAPTGIGVLYGKRDVLASMPPWQGGGNMIEDVTFETTRYQPPPQRFEAGTGSIADAVGLGAALDWLSRVGLENVARHEHDLLVYATAELCTVPGLSLVGTAAEKAGVISFVVAGRDTQEIATALDQEGIAVRGGHHCAQPILRRMGYETTVRASFAPYNIPEDIDALVDALRRIIR